MGNTEALHQSSRILRLLDRCAIVFLATAGCLGVFISILDFINVDLEKGPWRWLRGTETVTLLAISLLIIGVVIERYARLASIDKSLGELQSLVSSLPGMVIDSVAGVNVQKFEDDDEANRYVNERIESATKEVLDVTLGTGRVGLTQVAKKSFRDYRALIPRVCSSKGNIIYKEIMNFPPAVHLDWAEAILAERPSGYYLGYFMVPLGLPPYINFVVIDSSEVVFFSRDKAIFVSVRQKAVVEIFRRYFEEAWREAQILAGDDESAIEKLGLIRKNLLDAAVRLPNPGAAADA